MKSAVGLLAATAVAAVSAKINIHVVPHSHDDVGWLKTVDQYYLGKNQSIYHAGVQYIISSVVSALQENPERKFVYIEQAFFQRWWSEQTPERQALVKQLVANGQLVFANGGWCMHDEANPDYVSMIDQQALGVRWLVNEFGPQAVPRVQWQLDPFGHSSTQGSLFSSPWSGFTSVVWARISYDDRDWRAANQSLEWVWRPSPNLGDSALSLAHTLRYHYSAPDNNCYDAIACNGGEAINTDTNLEQYDAPAVVADFVSFLDSYASFYRGGDILVLFGDDFNYEEAQGYFVNIDKLINATNYLQPGGIDNGVYNVFYSDPTTWANAQLSSGTSFPLRTDDLMPYADGPHSYWGGYFTSRAALKGYIRSMTGYQTAVRQLQVASGGAQSLDASNPLYSLERALAVGQHHDAVAGTEKQHVAYDYAFRLSNGQAAADAFIGSALSTITGDASLASTITTCHLANVSICPSLEAGQATLVYVHNAQAQNKSLPLRLPVGFPSGVASWKVYASDGVTPVQAQVLPLTVSDTTLRSRYTGSDAPISTQWLAFVPSAPAAGFSIYFIVPSATVEDAPMTFISKAQRVAVGSKLRSGAAADYTISNGVIFVTISGTTGAVSGYTDVSNGINVPLAQQWMAYIPNIGDSVDGQASGAYIFRPNSSSTIDPANGGTYSLALVTGPVVSEARQVNVADPVHPDAGWISQVVRLWDGEPDVEFEWTVGPIDISNKVGLEIISRYSVGNWSTQGAWDTDSNCREWQHRVRNFRPSWNLTLSEPVAQNYVPINCAARLVDSATGNAMVVVTDRSEGGSSMVDGSLEIMVHRRLLNDDGRGVGEPLNETGVDGNGLVVRGKHWLKISPGPQAAVAHRARMQTGLLGQGVLAFAQLNGATPQAWATTYKTTGSALTSAPAGLPANVHVVTLQSQGPNAILIRLAHTFESGEDFVLSGNVTVSLANLVAGQTIIAATELTLVASMPLADVPSVTYNIDGRAQPVTLPYVPAMPSGTGLDVTLSSMQVRTFLCTTA